MPKSKHSKKEETKEMKGMSPAAMRRHMGSMEEKGEMPKGKKKKAKKRGY